MLLLLSPLSSLWNEWPHLSSTQLNKLYSSKSYNYFWWWWTTLPEQCLGYRESWWKNMQLFIVLCGRQTYKTHIKRGVSNKNWIFYYLLNQQHSNSIFVLSHWKVLTENCLLVQCAMHKSVNIDLMYIKILHFTYTLGVCILQILL